MKNNDSLVYIVRTPLCSFNDCGYSSRVRQSFIINNNDFGGIEDLFLHFLYDSSFKVQTAFDV